jgi:hypothetical protein
MAHSRRAESSYEEHIEDCFDNRRSVLEEEQRTLQSEQDSGSAGEGGTEKQPMFEAFALRCRWGRVDCLVGEGIVTILCGHIAVGAALRSPDSQIDHESCSRVRDKEDSASGLALQAASISLEILYSICRLCDKDQLTSVTLQIMKIWQSCSPLLQDTDDYADSGFSLQRSQRGGLCCGWWKVVAEMCRRSRHFALWLCEAGPDYIIAKCLILVLRSTDEALPMPVEGASDTVRDVQTVSTDSSRKRLRNLLESQRQTWNCSVWAIRVWRVCTVYGQGSRNISELLLAAQLERRLLTGAAATASKATPVTDGSSSSNSNNSSSSASSSDRHFVESIARAVGPGMVTRIVSPRRLTEVMWLLEQSAVSCAAIINTHSMKVETREKTPSTTSAVSAANRKRELKEEEAVGIALETARLLLGVAESLLTAMLSWPRLEDNNNNSSNGSKSSSRGNNNNNSSSSSRSLDSFVDADTSLLFSASAHFLSSLLGSWFVPSPSLSTESTQSTGQLARELLPLRELEDYSLRQHQILRPKQEQEHSVGLGLLQSCLQYAQYVRMATSSESQVTQEVEKKEEKGTSDASAPAGDDTSCERPVDKLQFQFAALHHLESKINSFVDTNISYALLSSLNSMLSPQLYADDDCAAGSCIRCSFFSWITEETSLSIMRLFSNVVSYIRMKPTPQGKSLSLPSLIIILITSSCLLIIVHLTDHYHHYYQLFLYELQMARAWIWT